jgi:hypothetical protein
MSSDWKWPDNLVWHFVNASLATILSTNLVATASFTQLPNYGPLTCSSGLSASLNAVQNGGLSGTINGKLQAAMNATMTAMPRGCLVGILFALARLFKVGVKPAK